MQNIYVIQLQRNELGIWEVYAMSEEMQKMLNEELKEKTEKIIKNLLKKNYPTKEIAELTEVNEQEVYKVANENNLHVNEG